VLLADEELVAAALDLDRLDGAFERDLRLGLVLGDASPGVALVLGPADVLADLLVAPLAALVPLGGLLVDGPDGVDQVAGQTGGGARADRRDAGQVARDRVPVGGLDGQVPVVGVPYRKGDDPAGDE
jgi:hypothetical protein